MNEGLGAADTGQAPRRSPVANQDSFYQQKHMKPHHRPDTNCQVLCQEHKEKCSFVCLYKTCSRAFELGCTRCRKEHAQHPNRLISITDFHGMLNKPIRYLENSTAFKLMNLKKKTQHIRNFRADILEKEIDLIDSNKQIKATMSHILQEHYRIRETVSQLQDESLANNMAAYCDSLKKCKEFLAYNPVKCELVFNNEVIKGSRVALEKHLKHAHNTTDSIRELLVKIIEVLLANCAYEEDDDDIQFEDDGGPSTEFNIYIKARTDVSESPNIRSKLEHEAFLEMFDEEKEALGKQVEMLEQEIDAKSSILSRIRGSNLANSSNMANSREEVEVVEGESPFAVTVSQLKRVTSLNEQHSASIGMLEEELTRERGRVGALEEDIQKLVNEREGIIERYGKEVDNWQRELKLLERDKSMAEQERDSVQASYQRTLQQYKQNNAHLITVIDELEKKEQELASIKKRQAEKDQLMEQMRVNSESTQEEARNMRRQFGEKEREMLRELAETRRQLREERANNSEGGDTTKELTEQIKQLKQQIVNMTVREQQLAQQLQKKDDQIIRKQQQRVQLESLLSCKVHQLQQSLLNSSKQSQPNYKRQQEEEARKYSQTKSMLDMSIKQNQELKDHKFELEHQIQQLKEEFNRKQESFLKILENKNRLQDEKSKVAQEKTVLEQKIISMQETISKLKAELKEKQQPSIANLPAQTSQISVAPSSKTHTSSLIPPSFQIQTVVSEQIDGSKVQVSAPPPQDKVLKEKPIFSNKSEKMQAYMAFKQMMKTVAEDVNILEERLKENSVIEKVYLKELERKRNENINLKKELENAKVYAPKSSLHQPSHKPLLTPREAEKKEKYQGYGKQQTQLYQTKKYLKGSNPK